MSEWAVPASRETRESDSGPALALCVVIPLLVPHRVFKPLPAFLWHSHGSVARRAALLSWQILSQTGQGADNLMPTPHQASPTQQRLTVGSVGGS